MTTSVQLSTQILSALFTKIQAGTATPEEIAIYSSGVQLLRDGADYESTIAGLSQIAVNTIGASQTSLTGNLFTATTALQNAATASVQGELPVGSLISFPQNQSNLVTQGSATYLKTGVITLASTLPNAASTTTYGSLEFGGSITGTLPANSYVKSMAYGNGIFVAGLFSPGVIANCILTSTDGLNWTSRNPFSLSYLSISFCNGVFFATVYYSSTSTTIYTSTDGITWTARTVPSGSWFSPFFSSGVYGLVDHSSGASITSSDLTTWATGFNGMGATPISFGIDSSGNTMATSNNGSAAYIIKIGTSVWTQYGSGGRFPFTYPCVVGYGNGTWMVCQLSTSPSQVYTSPDTFTWTKVGTVYVGTSSSPIYNGGLWQIGESTSKDNGITWDIRGSIGMNPSYNSLYDLPISVTQGGYLYTFINYNNPYPGTPCRAKIDSYVANTNFIYDNNLTATGSPKIPMYMKVA